MLLISSAGVVWCSLAGGVYTELISQLILIGIEILSLTHGETILVLVVTTRGQFIKIYCKTVDMFVTSYLT